MDKKEIVARRVAKELAPNTLVNLGIGLPTMVANYIDPAKKIMLHSENGFTGIGPSPEKGKEDWNIVNAGGIPSSILPGGAFFDSVMSFSIIRGGHLDATVLGAMEVDEEGNLANYMIPGKMVAGMGGAMDLTVGAKQVIIAMEHVNKNGKPKILKKCTLPLTASKEVDIIVTDMAFIRITPNGLVLEEVADGVSVDDVIKNTAAKLTIAKNVGKF